MSTHNECTVYLQGIWGIQVCCKIQGIPCIFQVILSPATHLYFDHPYEPDPEDRGLYWAVRHVDTQRVFSLMPDSFYDNIGKSYCFLVYT